MYLWLEDPNSAPDPALFVIDLKNIKWMSYVRYILCAGQVGREELQAVWSLHTLRPGRWIHPRQRNHQANIELCMYSIIQRSGPETSLLFKTDIHIKMILVQNNPNYHHLTASCMDHAVTHWVKLGALLTQRTPCNTEWTASGMDRSSVDSRPNLSQHKFSPNACTASPMDLIFRTVLIRT